MAVIEGKVVFDRERSAAVNAGDAGIPGVSVILQEISNGDRLGVLTDSMGNYQFTGVPAGSFRIVESFGQIAEASPANFADAAPGTIPVGVNPPITQVVNPPAGSTNLDSLTPDTLFVTVTQNETLTNQDFLNGPVIYTPIPAILDRCVLISGENLIEAADDGTFGTFPAGTKANTGAPTEPYPGVTPDFTYVLPNPNIFVPIGGEYTVQNLMTNAMSETIGAWWRIADHTAGNETGRMMVVNGFNPGAVFFRAVVDVQTETTYLFTAWILNLFKVVGFPNPELGVRVLDEEGHVIFSQDLGILIPVNTNAPEWKQFGTVINSLNNTSLTVEFLSEGPEVIGNDYAIDDVEFHEVMIPEFIPVKTVSTPSAGIGETVMFQVKLENTCTQPLTDVFFRDIVPDGFQFVAGSVIVNGITEPAFDPNIGFAVPDILGGETATVIFSALAVSVPNPNPAVNQADFTYFFTPVEGGIPSEFTVLSNEVTISAAVLADLSVSKSALPASAVPGAVLTFTITVTNLGPSTAENVLLTDMLSPLVQNPEFSLNNGATFSPWTGSVALGTLAAGEIKVVLIRGTVAENASGNIANTAIVSSTTPDPNPDNNRFTLIVPISTERCQALIDVLGSVALQEAALSAILQAEGEKMQAFIAQEGVTAEELFALNGNVRGLVNGLTRLETILQAKLETAAGELQDCSKGDEN